MTIPARDYGLAALLMADAITEAEAAGTPITPALEAAAAARGSAIGDSCEPGSADALDRVLLLLSEQGYQPSRVDDTAYLSNCPFHRLARSHPELVCRMNHALIAAIIAAAVGPVVDAQLDPGENRCCVTLIVRSPDRPEQ